MLSSKIEQLITVLETQELDVSITDYFCIVKHRIVQILKTLMTTTFLFLNKLKILDTKWSFTTVICRIDGCVSLQK